MKKLMITACCSVALLSGCHAPVNTFRSGEVSLQVQWPKIQLQDFRTQDIPDETTSIKVIIDGDGLSEPIEKTITRQAGENKVIFVLPPGSKNIRIQALDAQGKLLAEDQRSAQVISGQVIKTQFNLQLVIEKEKEKEKESPKPPSIEGGGGSPSGGAPSAPTGPTPKTPVGGGGSPSGPSNPTGPAEDPANPDPNIPSGFDPSPSILTSSGGGGGGSSSSSSSTTTIQITELIANPAALSGLGYLSGLKVTLNNGTVLADGQYEWSCDQGLGSFDRQDSPSVVWKAPDTAPPGASPHSFTLRVKITDTSGILLAEDSVTITVESGSGSVGIGNGDL